ncbi:MAG: RNA polymerase sigma factor [Chloroflexi bacterium]|nr:RNA polymerase sigma factor [Chloroflexota bacterium]MBT7081119.1 RNA polymerase sigma factor [Chloroflexota bacterium]MBT7289270.1 RNA polymerase sigma factor [Chloroflexota bacterium]
MAKHLDMADFENIFEQYKNMVFRTACLTLSDRSQADDVLQDVFIKVYRLGKSFDSQKGSMATWLRRITVNECITRQQKSGKYSYSLDELHQNGHHPDEEIVEFNEKLATKQSIEQMLSSLSGRYRAALMLRYIDDLSYEQIAETLDIPLGTVKSRISAAITSLKKKQLKEVQNELQTR